MTKVCSDCGKEPSEGIFTRERFGTCDKCGRYICGDCARETGQGDFCKECFEDL